MNVMLIGRCTPLIQKPSDFLKFRRIFTLHLNNNETKTPQKQKSGNIRKIQQDPKLNKS